MSIAPLGRPVVPPVYCRHAMSRAGSIRTLECRVREEARSSLKNSGSGPSSGSGEVSSARFSRAARSGSRSARRLLAGRYSVSEVTMMCSTAVPLRASSRVS